MSGKQSLNVDDASFWWNKYSTAHPSNNRGLLFWQKTNMKLVEWLLLATDLGVGLNTNRYKWYLRLR